MRPMLWLVAALGGILAWAAAGEPPTRFKQLAGWGGGDPTKTAIVAADVGFTDLIVWRQDHDYLNSLVREASRNGLDVWVSIHLSDLADWRRRRPNTPPPLQPLNAEEQAALERTKAELKAGRSLYQHGGEPVAGQTEVLESELLCFHHPEVVRFHEEQLRDILAVPGVKGVALDFFGYRNYRCCRCERSRQLAAAWRRQHLGLSDEQASDQWSLESLVAFCNHLADYARRTKPGILVTGHVYPVFLPEPLYGNRLDWDVCGQTAAWFFEPFWSLEKITQYSRAISGEAKQYHPRAEGAGLIGVYVQPKRFAVKGAARLEQELRAMLAGGLTRVQVCSLNDVLNDAETSAVFRRFAPRR